MGQSPSLEANSSTGSQEIPLILWNLNVQHRIHNSHPPVPTLSQGNPLLASPSKFRKIHLILPSPLRLVLPSGLCPSRLPTKALYAPLVSLNTCHILRPSHSSRFDQPNDIWRGGQSIKLLFNNTNVLQ